MDAARIDPPPPPTSCEEEERCGKPGGKLQRLPRGGERLLPPQEHMF